MGPTLASDDLPDGLTPDAVLIGQLLLGGAFGPITTVPLIPGSNLSNLGLSQDGLWQVFAASLSTLGEHVSRVDGRCSEEQVFGVDAVANVALV
jgi:hypothetical protein